MMTRPSGAQEPRMDTVLRLHVLMRTARPSIQGMTSSQRHFNRVTAQDIPMA